jgi:hypothetical protein
MPFICSICEEYSTDICVSCTKDTCANHLCAKCARCSDCCTCDIALEAESVPEPRLVYKTEVFEDNEDEEEEVDTRLQSRQVPEEA